MMACSSLQRFEFEKLGKCQKRVVLCLTLMSLVLLITLFSLLDSLIIPNFHGSKFELGSCVVTTESLPDPVLFPWKDCSCGGTCSSKFPCITISGEFTPYGPAQVGQAGMFYTNYTALKSKCFAKPSHCVKDTAKNARSILDEAERLLDGSWNNSFECWGYEDTFYFKNEYSWRKATLALCLLLFFAIPFPMIILVPFREGRKILKRVGNNLLYLVSLIVTCFYDNNNACCDSCCCSCLRRSFSAVGVYLRGCRAFVTSCCDKETPSSPPPNVTRVTPSAHPPSTPSVGSTHNASLPPPYSP